MAVDDYFTTDDEGHTSHLSDTPYHTPPGLLSVSRRSSGRVTSSSVTPITPPPLSSDGFSLSKDQQDAESLSVHQFTPSLHASLVSEILNLRRELDSKHTFIERLEAGLSSARQENDSLQETLSKNAKESRNVKRQLQSIEEGTLSAIEDLSKERDQANAANVEIKKRLDTSQRRAKTQEDEVKRIQTAWDQEKRQWQDEKRGMERKVHVAEGRLKSVIEEVAAQEVATREVTQATHTDAEICGVEEETTIESLPGHKRQQSSVANAQSTMADAPAGNGMSLADELQLEDLDEDEQEIVDDHYSEYEAQEYRLERAKEFRTSIYLDEKARRVLGMQAHSREQSLDQAPVARIDAQSPNTGVVNVNPRRRRPSVDAIADASTGSPTGKVRQMVKRLSLTHEKASVSSAIGSRTYRESVYGTSKYVSTGVQFSPPPSPRPETAHRIVEDISTLSLDVEANQRRKRDPLTAPVQTHSRAQSEPCPSHEGTLTQLPSPPSTPHALNKIVAKNEEPDTPPSFVTVRNNPSAQISGKGIDEHKQGETVVVVVEDSDDNNASESVSGGSSLDKADNEVDGSEAERTDVDSENADLVSTTTDSLHTLVAVPITMSAPPEEVKWEMNGTRSISTQTDASEDRPGYIPPLPTRAPPPPPPPIPMAVPSIAIHPPEPGLEPTSEAVLPPGTRNFGCQVNINPIVSTRSIAVQTEGLPLDKRAVELPAHLLPSALLGASVLTKSGKDKSSVLETVEVKQSQASHDISPDSAPSPPPIPTMPRSQLDRDTNDDADEGRWARLRRALRYRPEYDFPDDLDDDLSDGEYGASAPTVRQSSHRSKQNRPFFDPPTPVPEDEKVIFTQPSARSGRASAGSRGSVDPIGRNAKLSKASALRSNPSHKSRTPSNGSAASSSNYSKSGPSLPPFAIPVRGSSAGIKQTQRKANNTSPTRRSGKSSPRNSYDSKQPTKKPVLRKSRSAAVLEDEKRQKTFESGAQPLHSHSVRESGAHVLNVSRNNLSKYQSARRAPPALDLQTEIAPSTLPTGNASVGTAVQHSVVDAITATMIGEWMWKYVRKRKSFGVSEKDQDFSKDARHKRWVWLSPHERTVMWSSKQPMSNAALMGKTGRKFVIQSVLDVKDDTPLSKSGQEAFNRSILVLTPARALKFTATNAERHYLWLTALSFLAHHTSHGPLDLDFLPPQIPSLSPRDSQSSRSRASSIRRGTIGGFNMNSFRSAKDKVLVRSQQSSGPATPNTQDSEFVPVYGSAAINNAPQLDSVYEHNGYETATAAALAASDSAFAPNVPRVPAHSRRRSATNPTSRGRGGRPLITGKGNSSFRSPSAEVKSNSSIFSSTTRSSSVQPVSGSLPITSSHNSHPQSRSSSVRNGGTSGARSPREALMSRDETVSDDATFQGNEMPPRPSDASAEFGGNNNFFDAVGMVRMDAFVGPGFNAGRPGSRNQKPGATLNGMPLRNEGIRTDGASRGPAAAAPSVGRTRQVRRRGGINPEEIERREGIQV